MNMTKSRDDYPPIDVSKLKTFPMAQRQHKVDQQQPAQLPEKDATVPEFLDSFPDFLGVQQLRQLAQTIAAAVKKGRPVIFAMGAHVIKVGCSPIVIDLMQRSVITSLALNGAGGIHDFEMALFCKTSEDVGTNIHEGRFGMTTEAPEALAEAAKLGRQEGIGLGAALGKIINDRQLQHRDISLLAQADRLDRLATIHVAIGTDTVHMHPEAEGADIGAASLIDFRRLTSAVADLGNGGVWVNIGSAVLLPEVFLKCVSIARNLGANLDEMYTANLDMLQHYRPQQNVISRPVREGHSFSITGHHEILLPLLRMWLLRLL
jgi:hypothetical protein